MFPIAQATSTVSYLTATVAFCTFVVALNQYFLARTKIRQDLFDKRFKVYEAALAFARYIATNQQCKNPGGWNRIPIETEYVYEESINTAHFLFGSEIEIFLKQMSDQATAYNNLSIITALDSDSFAADREAATLRQEEIRLWFLDAWQNIVRQRFAPYLSFSEFRE